MSAEDPPPTSENQVGGPGPGEPRPPARQSKLGRGLSALFGEEGTDTTEPDRLRPSKTMPVEFLRPSRFQTRHSFDQEEIDGLAESIRRRGVLQPVLVRRHPVAANAYEIIAGERRWRAAQQAQLHEIPVIVREFSDRDALEISLVENLQREDLTALEEAEGLQRLMTEFGHSQDDLAQAIGRSRSHVANMLRLLSLPEPVKEMLQSGALTAGHARALINADDPVGLARLVVRRALNVRQAERLAAKGVKAAGARTGKDADIAALERDLSDRLGLRVTINHRAGKGGSLVIHYRTLEQFDDVLRRLSGSTPRAAEAGDTGPI
ncbi:MAG: ParB/RepB/Spo0J family partition protein [Kiloniellales bacterium]